MRPCYYRSADVRMRMRNALLVLFASSRNWLICRLLEQCMISNNNINSGKCYHPWSLARLIILTSILIIPDITTTSSNNCLIDSTSLIIENCWKTGRITSFEGHFTPLSFLSSKPELASMIQYERLIQIHFTTMPNITLAHRYCACFRGTPWKTKNNNTSLFRKYPFCQAPTKIEVTSPVSNNALDVAVREGSEWTIRL